MYGVLRFLEQSGNKIMATLKGSVQLINEGAINLMQSFSGSFINQRGEFIAHENANEFFTLRNCKDDFDIKCKVLEWLSRGAYKTEPFRSRKKNTEFNAFMLDGINKFLGTAFTCEEMARIYQELGNGVNRTLCIKFIESGFDMNVLSEQLPTE